MKRLPGIRKTKSLRKARRKTRNAEKGKPMRNFRATKLKISAISLLALSLVLIFSTVCLAGVQVGKVLQLNGPLFAKKADSTVMVLSVNSSVEEGDTLITENKTYARILFSDDSEMILRPNTRFRISEYYFDKASPKGDKSFFDLLKGGLRSITGMIGKRGSLGSYKMTTVTAVIGVRGTSYEARICEDNCGSLPDGLYLSVSDGIIGVSNNAGSLDVGLGQFAFVANAESLPVILPGNPGLDFSLPLSLGTGTKDGRPDPALNGCMCR
jgi:hypothetical protein